MHVTRIAVRHWRGLDDLAVEDLAPGLNLICGPNEAGKSRLVQALWYALFESSKGQAENKKALASWGVGAEKPRVEVEFELAGVRWTVEKQFLGTGTNTALRSTSERLTDEAAEARLRSLLRVAAPTTKGMKREDAGIWPLLWVEQHESNRAPTADAGADARHRLQDRLTAEVGEVAAGERGQALMQRARELRDRYFTPGRGDERGPLKDARAAVAQLEHSVEAARMARAAVADDAEALVRLRAQEHGYVERVAEADAALRAARARQGEASQAREALAEAQRREDAARVALEKAREQRASREEAEAALAERGERVRDLEQARSDREGALLRASEAASEADAVATEADSHATAARAALDALRRAERRRADGEALNVLRTRHGRVQEINGRIRSHTETRASIPEVAAEDVTRLESLRETHTTARAKLEGASARLTLEAEHTLEVDGEELEAGASRSWRIDDDRTLIIAGVGRLHIAPGGGDLAALRDAAGDAVRTLTEALAALGVSDFDAARAAAEQRRDLDRILKDARAELEREAPDGLAALDTAIHERELRLDLQPGAPVPEEDGGAADAAAMETAEREEQAAREALERERARREAAREAHQGQRTALAELDARLATAREEVDAQTRRVESLPASEAVASAFADAERALQAATGQTVTARSAYEALGGDAAAEDVERLEKSARDLRDEQTRIGREIAILEDRLSAAGDDGRHERVQDLEAELDQARALLMRTEREAAAALRLSEVLETAARDARERLARPVVERIRPYLADLFPGTEVWLDESMDLQGLRGERAEEHFEALSGGAREQLSLLVRIGLAEVLGAEESWPLVLDDALVNTDPERIQRVQRLLFKASRRMQILLFTCHGRLYDTAGAARRIEVPARPR